MSVTDTQIYSTTNRSAPHHPGFATDHDTEAIIQEIERTRSDPSDPWMRDENMRLPGFGDGLAQDDCGDEFPAFCSCCGEIKDFGRTCYSAICTRCAQSWVMRTAKRVTAKLLAVRAYRASFKEKHQRLHHFVISPPAEWSPKGDNKPEKAIQTVKRVLKDACGLDAWICGHPMRGRDGDDRGAWKGRLFNGAPWSDMVGTGDPFDPAPKKNGELTFSPHFHCVAVGHEMPGGNVTKEIEERTGWILHRITKKRSAVSIYGEYDLARVVTYCLSHTGIYPAGDEDVAAPEAERTRAWTRWTGPNVQNATASTKDEWEQDAVVRAVAPMTLGVRFNDLACSEKATADHDHDDGDEPGGIQVNLSKAAASRKGPRTATPGDGDDFGELGSVGDDGLGSALQEDSDDVEPKTRCNGRMLPISKANPYLASDKWCAAAPHADELRETHTEWAAKDRFVPGGEADPEEVRIVEEIMSARRAEGD